MNAPSPLAEPDAPCLQLQDLRVGFDGEAPLLGRWSARLGPGLTLLAGDTGSGKSTVLRVLAGEQPAAGGTLALAGAALPGDVNAWRRLCFWVDPATRAFHEMGVRDCVARLRADDPAFDDAHWQSLAEAFGLAPHLDKGMHMLSTGSRRKVWLACALASGRALTLLDEPTAALDAASIRALQAALAALAQDARRIVVVASGEPWPTLAWRQRVQLPMA
ncbi:ATP-binding cassette domain-containing protein [Xenophilus arseniciresistens]|uniref:ATP-binding cassette domain-containing protein n=1 Tax=Xenophilus arseniciresistens TaxID=1283306 RepID=A0AAE3T2N2_9BURK|nr:ATP-binding cassette domain-containing protein [Xenophilus arseniciresistens]MDA7419241.1 ATP-binding cassette domain-containing protein [Xenophilus arseniciresistens]